LLDNDLILKAGSSFSRVVIKDLLSSHFEIRDNGSNNAGGAKEREMMYNGEDKV
jgi:hypothetical protein